jgi:hypothetical protein
MRFSLAACVFFPLCVESAGHRLRGTAHLSGSPATSATKVYGEERELEEETGFMNEIAELEESLGLDDDENGEDDEDGEDDADNQSSEAAGPDDPATNSTLEQGNADVNGSEPIDDLSTTPAEPADPTVLGNPELSNVTMPNPDLALYGTNTAISDTFGTVDPPLNPSFDSILNDTTTRIADRLPEDTPIDKPSLVAPGNPQDLSGTSSSSGTGPETTATSPADTAAAPSLDAIYPSATASNMTIESASDQEAVGSNSAPEVVPPASSEEAAGRNSTPEVVPPASPDAEATGIDSAPEVVPPALPHEQATGSNSAPEAAPPASPYENVTGIRSAPDLIPYASSHEQTADSNPEHGKFPAGYGNPVPARNGDGSAPKVPPAGDSSSNAREYTDEITTRDKSAEPERPSTVIDTSEEQTDDDNASEEQTDDDNDFDGADTDDAEAEPNEESYKEDNPWKDPKWADKTPEEVAALARADAFRVMKAKYVPWMLISMSLLSTAFTLFVVQQIVENPNGTTSKICQCMVAVARMVTFPFRYLMCGADCSSGARSRRRDRRTHDVLRNEVLRNRNGEFS